MAMNTATAMARAMAKSIATTVVKTIVKAVAIKVNSKNDKCRCSKLYRITTLWYTLATVLVAVAI